MNAAGTYGNAAAAKGLVDGAGQFLPPLLVSALLGSRRTGSFKRQLPCFADSVNFGDFVKAFEKARLVRGAMWSFCLLV